MLLGLCLQRYEAFQDKRFRTQFVKKVVDLAFKDDIIYVEYFVPFPPFKWEEIPMPYSQLRYEVLTVSWVDKTEKGYLCRLSSEQRVKYLR